MMVDHVDLHINANGIKQIVKSVDEESNAPID